VTHHCNLLGREKCMICCIHNFSLNNNEHPPLTPMTHNIKKGSTNGIYA